jgi:hypothetical protein
MFGGLVRVQALSQPATPGRPIGPASSGLGEGLAGQDVLVPSRLVGWAHACRHCHQVYGVSSDTLVRLTSGLSEHCVKKQCGLADLCFGRCTALDLCLSRVRTGVAVMGQDCNYQLDTTKLGRKRAKKMFGGFNKPHANTKAISMLRTLFLYSCRLAAATVAWS